MARKRRTFSPEFKEEAVRLCQVGDKGVGQVAKDLDLTEAAPRAGAYDQPVGGSDD